jgi:DNA-binding LytR/AlgR family response regulator
MMIQAIAIDDEPPALDVLQIHSSKVPFLELKACCLTVAEALDYLQQNPVDLFFLDVEMPGLKGTDFARMAQAMGKPFVFTTAHPQYALDGFDLQAIDFLLKPIAADRFLQACNRAYQHIVQQKGLPSGIFVKDGYDWVKVNLEQVTYIQSDTNLLFIHHADHTKVTTRMTLSEMLELLPADAFIRVHKSYIVAVQAIQKIERHQLMVGKTAIPLAGTYREQVEKKLLRKH